MIRAMPYIYLLIIDLACLAAGVYLVVTEHYGWAWIPFLVMLGTTVGECKTGDSK